MRKPRESKYQKMIGKKINEVYTDFQMKLESENYEITGYIPGGEPRISKSGRPYKVYKVQLENSVWISTQMFNKYVKRGYFSKNVHKKIDNAKMFERFNESINNEFEPLIEVKEEPKIKQVFELVLSTRKVEEPVEVVEPTDELHDLKTTYNLRQLKGAYRTLARRYHPDNLETGDSDRFKLVKTIFDVRKLIIEVNLETFGYDDPDFAELVDMAEDLHKTMHNIQY